MDTLRSIAEISIAIVGFATLVTLFHGKIEKWKFQDRRNIIRFMMMVELALFNVLYSFLPIILATFFNDDTAYRISAAAYGVSTVGYFIFVHQRNKRLGGSQQVSDLRALVIYMSCMIMISFAFLLSAGEIGTNYEGQYLILMLFLIVLDLYFFIGLVHYSIPTPPDIEDEFKKR